MRGCFFFVAPPSSVALLLGSTQYVSTTYHFKSLLILYLVCAASPKLLSFVLTETAPTMCRHSLDRWLYLKFKDSKHQERLRYCAKVRPKVGTTLYSWSEENSSDSSEFKNACLELRSRYPEIGVFRGHSFSEDDWLHICKIDLGDYVRLRDSSLRESKDVLERITATAKKQKSDKFDVQIHHTRPIHCYLEFLQVEDRISTTAGYLANYDYRRSKRKPRFNIHLLKFNLLFDWVKQSPLCAGKESLEIGYYAYGDHNDTWIKIANDLEFRAAILHRMGPGRSIKLYVKDGTLRDLGVKA